MSYFADHLAWQQRVAQEFKAQSSSSMDDQMFQANGQWFNYPDLVNYLKQTQGKKGMGQGNMSRTFGNQGNSGIVTSPEYQYDGLMSPRNKGPVVEDTKSNYSYAAKSRVLYSRKGVGSAQSKRSKTGTRLSSTAKLRDQVGPYVRETESQLQKKDTKSQLNYIAMKRFNETPLEGDRRSQARSIFSKNKSQVGSKAFSNATKSVFSQQQKKIDIYKAVDELDDLQIDQISAIISNNNPVKKVAPQEETAPVDQDEVAGEEADQVKDLQVEEDRFTSVSALKQTESQVSVMSGRTYISNLQNQLLDEKEARQKLESELEELKKISSEITSQLSQIQKKEAEKAAQQ